MLVKITTVLALKTTHSILKNKKILVEITTFLAFITTYSIFIKLLVEITTF